MGGAMEEIMEGKVDTPQIISFLTALSKKGETVEELTAAVSVMRVHVTKITSSQALILDTCGTGGDAKGTFNISTTVAFVASGCGVAVAKHGNRSVSSYCGSADILEALGVNIHMTPLQLQDCLDTLGIAFLFAQALHPAMKYAMPARIAIGTRTMFNILGPLSNPAGATHQLVGVFDKHWTKILAQVLCNLGIAHALVVHGNDGLDEISLTDKTFVAETSHCRIKTWEISPQDFGFKKATLEDLRGGSVADNVRMLLDVLTGKKGASRDIVVLNSAAALYAADKVHSIKEGIALAQECIDTKKAFEKLILLKEFSSRTPQPR